MREPLLVRWPAAIAAGTVRGELVHTMDLAPTMLAACGLEVPAHMHGTPLFGADGTFSEAPREFAFAGRDRMDESEDTSRTVRDRRYRYVRHLHPGRPAMPHIDYPDHTDTWRELRSLASREARELGSGQAPSVLTPLQRSLLAPEKPAEELYDLEADPHETRNLVGDPAHGAALGRLRAALTDWQERYGDLGLIPERELLERWRPDGRRRLTEEPCATLGEHGYTAECATPGASIGWTQDPPGDVRERTVMDRVTGQPEDDGRHWRLYTGPVSAVGPVWFRAWRLGFEPSRDVLVGDTQDGDVRADAPQVAAGSWPPKA